MSFAIVLPVSLFMIGDSGTAEAMVSLPYIQNLKEGGGAYKILEIVPDSTQGSIGYLIDGAEPCSGWAETAGEQVGASARSAYVGSLFSGLVSAGILGSGNTAPLQSAGSYSEAFPWMPHSGYSEMRLDHWETAANVSGSFTASDSGEYRAYYNYAPDPGGSYLQLISALISDTDTTAGFFYYGINFQKISSSTVFTNGELIYSVTAGVPDISPTIDGTVVNLQCVGVYGSSSFPGIDSDIVSYVASPAGVPQTSYDSAHPYRAVGSDFRSAASGEQGLFSRALAGYKYVGSGGDFNYSASGSDSSTVMYDTVFYTGGFTNNNWLLRYVFDWEPDKGEAQPGIDFKLTTLRGSDVAADTLAQYDLIVLAGATAPGAAAAAFSTANDITPDVKNEILTLSASSDTRKGTPILFDRSLAGGSLNVNALANSLDSSWGQAHVSGNLFGATYPLATSGFITDYSSGLYTANGTPFYAVYDEIKDQNLLRSISGVDALPTDVTPARAVRCIINSLGQVAEAGKSAISVLDLEPGRGQSLNSNTVLQWLGYESNSTDIRVTITTMSTSEFLGKINDISEDYDLVYIGSDLGGFSTAGYCGETVANYFDDNMDGLVYSNIGDLVVSGGDSGFSESGLLDRDYSATAFKGSNGSSYYALHTGTTASPYNASRTFRYSGNDLTRSKMEQLESFASSGYPVVVADNLRQGISTTGDYTVGVCSYTASYRTYTCLYTPNISFDSSALRLTVSLSPVSFYNGYTNSGNVSTATCTLYKCGTGGAADTLISTSAINSGTPAVFDMSPSGFADGSAYYCTVSVSKILNSATYSVKNEISRGMTCNGNLYKNVDSFRVDSSSNMYQLLGDTLAKPNVMSVSEALADSSTLREYVNLAKPKIVFSTDSSGNYVYPTVYSKSSDGSVTSLAAINGSYYLEYRFTISNESDPTPTQTSYFCSLYIDENGDGLYSDSSRASERLNDIIIREWNSSAGAAGALVTNGSLRAGVEYYVSRKLPDDKIGLIPWKLEVMAQSSTGVSGAHSSYHNYTHVPVPTDSNGNPESDKIPSIDILQVNTSRFGASGIDLGAQMATVSSGNYYSSVTKRYYAGIYGKLIADISSDFDIAITTTKANLLDSSSTWVHDGVNYTSVSAYLNSYDMIILGFDDCYQELSLASAQAVVNYIGSGKATLFTHDCTSFYFLPLGNYRTENYGTGQSPYYVYSSSNNTTSFSMFGYNFNMTIRDKVGLDRYGVTNPTYGLTKYSNPTLPASGIVASSAYLGLTAAQKSALLNAGYSIAYQPRSGKNATVAETQGLTKGVLTRFSQFGGKPTSDAYQTGLETTGTVRQVNEGQITTYPYNINTAAFTGGGTADTMSVATTHAQYQQLNMNSDDIVVWYCLSGGSFDYTPDDVINSYYLYSRGNVTYSGCGHTTSTINANEAKLFVNTMVAAYRIAISAPTVSFSDSTGQKTLQNYLIPADGSGVLDLGSSSTVRNMYFEINDTNISQKALTAGFTYGTGGTALSGVRVYDAQTDTAVNTGESLISGVVYCIKLDQVWSLLPDSVKATVGSGIPINITVSSRIGNITNTGTDTVTLRSYTLASLR